MAQTKRVTLRQVADHAKVSPMTLSNFLNGRFELAANMINTGTATSLLAGQIKWRQVVKLASTQ